MGNPPTVNRIFMVKAGMTPQDVINSNEATAQQKKMAYVFDSDGVAGYSQREADVFNATLITDRGQNGVSLWTRYKDDSRKETKYVGDVTSFKYAPTGDVKPYVVAKKQTPTTPKVDQAKSLATQIIQEFEQTGKGELKVETYDNGNIKSKKYKDEGYFGKEATVTYYKDGKPESSKVRVFSRSQIGGGWIETENKSYYSNGKLKSSKTKEPNYFGKETYQTYHENNNPKSKVVKEWDRKARFEKNYKGEYEYVGDWVETTHIEYDSNGNVIKNAKVTK